MWTKIRDFFKGMVSELKRVSWTSRRELIGATSAVLVLTIIMVLFVYGMDSLFSFVLRKVLEWVG